MAESQYLNEAELMESVPIQIKFPVVPFIMLSQVAIALSLWMKS